MHFRLELLVIWNTIGSSVIVDAMSFKPLLSLNRAVACAVDRPTMVIPLSELQVGFPPGVPDPIRCAFRCTRFGGCASFNYRQPRDALIDSGQCELYTTPPTNCTIIDNYCQHYQVSRVHVVSECV